MNVRSPAVPGLPMCLACTPPRATCMQQVASWLQLLGLGPSCPSLPCTKGHCKHICTPTDTPRPQPSLWLNDNPRSRLQADFVCPDDWSLLDLEADWLDYDEAPEERHWEEAAGEEGGSPEQQRSGSDSEGQGGPGTAAEGGPQAGLRVFRPRRPPPRQVRAAQLWGPACAFVCISSACTHVCTTCRVEAVDIAQRLCVWCERCPRQAAHCLALSMPGCRPSWRPLPGSAGCRLWSTLAPTMATLRTCQSGPRCLLGRSSGGQGALKGGALGGCPAACCLPAVCAWGRVGTELRNKVAL